MATSGMNTTSEPGVVSLVDWHLNPLFDPLWREMEGEYLAFDRGCGSTHRFDAITATILIGLQNGLTTPSSLVDHVANTLEFMHNEALTHHVNDVLLDLERKDYASSRQE